MIKILASCEMSGEDFSPRTVESRTGLVFYAKQEKGEWSKTLRRQMPHGTGGLKFHQDDLIDLSHSAAFMEWLGILKENLTEFRRAGATDIWLSLGILFKNQGDLEVNCEAIRALSSLGITVTVSAYEVDSFG